MDIAGKGQVTDFDFLLGNWTVENRRLKQRHVGSDEWDIFPATQQFWKMLGGVMNVDEFNCPARGFSGASIRTLDQTTRRWSICWVNSASGIMFPPVHGQFCSGQGIFYGTDEDNGTHVDVRFTWSFQPDGRPLWSQAYSTDVGANWETNWTMDFTRVS
ncbi:hypothetical protein ABIB57_002884 [Devosia sp. UYZn731]|uniref:hypothetical protein n=1 Tax=Devosia sp. UYZn731 TaxID=3156345 RepID=UPI00339A8D1B